MMPFPGGIENVSNGALILSALSALLYLFALEQPQSWKRSAVKTLSVLLLAFVAAHQNAPLLLIGALALSAAGDFFLSRDGDRNFLAGLASFLAAHIAYIALFFDAGVGLPALLESPHLAIALAMLASSLYVLSVLMRRVPGTLRLPVIAYCAAIVLMGLSALATGRPLIILGAVLFMASDTLLSWERFVMNGLSRNRLPIRIAVWVLYYVAQLLILLGFLLQKP